MIISFSSPSPEAIVAVYVLSLCKIFISSLMHLASSKIEYITLRECLDNFIQKIGIETNLDIAQISPQNTRCLDPGASADHTLLLEFPSYILPALITIFSSDFMTWL